MTRFQEKVQVESRVAFADVALPFLWNYILSRKEIVIPGIPVDLHPRIGHGNFS